jgi:xanthine dehydrogenase YagS FAD-binding subunit
MSMLPSFNYVRAGSLADAIKQLGSPNARLHAGGTDLIGCLRDGVFKADKVVSLTKVGSLRGISPVAATGGMRIGALTTLTEVASHPELQQKYPVLAQAAAAVGSPQLRNQGTIGGNLCQRPRCWYFRGDFQCARKGGDTCFAMQGENHDHCIFGGSTCYIVHPSDTAPALVALGARARISGPAGPRTVSLGSFFLLPNQSMSKENVLKRGEVLTEIQLPAVVAGTRSSYRKVRARGSWDFALASIALMLRLEAGKVQQARIVLGGVAPTPWRVQEAETAITGAALTPDTAARAAEAAVKGAEPLAQNGYKVALVRGLVTQALLAIAQ